MRKLMFITSIIFCKLLILTHSRSTHEVVGYVEPGEPGFEVWAESDVAKTFWKVFGSASTSLAAAEALNHHTIITKDCSHLTTFKNHLTPHSDICHVPAKLHCDPNAPYRTLGGTCNNLQNPTLGAQYSAYNSQLPPNYHDCIHSIRRSSADNSELPSPRVIGNKLERPDAPPTSSSVLNKLSAWFGQLVTHDTGSRINVQRNDSFGPGIKCCSENYDRMLPKEHCPEACRAVDIPKNDPYFSQFNAGCLNYISSQTIYAEKDCEVVPARQSNSVSAYMDLTIVFGDDKQTLDKLRTGISGQLKTSAGNVLPVTPNCTQQPCYYLGDPRVVQTPMLSLMHSLFLRLHNSIAPQIKTRNDELAFQKGKRLTTALYQRIIYNEWLPTILGQAECTKRKLSCDPSKFNCGSYNPNVDPSNTNEHTHAVFRWFHALIPKIINFYGSDGALLMSSDLVDMNSTQGFILETHYNSMLRGLLFDQLDFGDYSIELRNRLMRDAKGMGIDLFSIDIQRARDHGVRAFHDYIPLCTNSHIQINTWADLNAYFSPDDLQTLSTIYKSPRDIDLLVGVLREVRSASFPSLGKIGTCIFAEQFARFKFGDRFFYQWNHGTNTFTQAQLQEIEQFSAAKFLCTVTDIGAVPREPFLTANSKTNPMVSCDSISKFNYDLFSD